MKLIDTHAHLNMKAYAEDLSEVVNRAVSAGVEKIIDVGTDINSSRAAIKNSERFDSVYAVAGIHPHDAAKVKPDDLDELPDLLDKPKTVALGEIGLDYHYDFSPRDVQKDLFRKQLELALEKNIPVVIHIREAMADGLEILDSFGNESWQGVFHCFGGSVYDVPRVLERGFLISFTGVLTFKNFKKQDVVQAVPVHKLMIETDAPYMTPVPFRGERNEPAYLGHFLKSLSGIYKMDESEIARMTTQNAEALFGLG